MLSERPSQFFQTPVSLLEHLATKVTRYCFQTSNFVLKHSDVPVATVFKVQQSEAL